MESERLLLVAGVTLLAGAALLGFVQERHRAHADAFAAWRVVHAGGTAGAVQLLALAAVWNQLAGAGRWSSMLAWALIVVAWAFFLGPLARALGQPLVARAFNTVGAVLAVPCYVALPLVLLR